MKPAQKVTTTEEATVILTDPEITIAATNAALNAGDGILYLFLFQPHLIFNVTKTNSQTVKITGTLPIKSGDVPVM